jgi:hypothetical protein
MERKNVVRENKLLAHVSCHGICRFVYPPGLLKMPQKEARNNLRVSWDF